MDRRKGGGNGKGHTEDLIQLLQRQALRLGQEQQHGKEANDVPRGIPAESPRRREGSLQTRIGNRQDEVKEPRRGRGETHPQRTDIQRICLRGIRKRHGPFTGRVDNPKEVDPKGDAGNVRGVMCIVGD